MALAAWGHDLTDGNFLNVKTFNLAYVTYVSFSCYNSSALFTGIMSLPGCQPVCLVGLKSIPF